MNFNDTFKRVKKMRNALKNSVRKDQFIKNVPNPEQKSLYKS